MFETVVWRLICKSGRGLVENLNNNWKYGEAKLLFSSAGFKC